MAEQNSFTIILNKFYQGFAPTWFKNSLSTLGNAGQANAMRAVDITDPTWMTQGPGIALATNGSNIGDKVNFIQSKFLTTGGIYGIGNTKLYEFASSIGLTSDSDFPHTINNGTASPVSIAGKSVATMGGYLYYFYNNTSSAGNIGRHTLGTSTFDDDWGSTVPTGAASLQANADYPVAVKETLMLFGNGRYVGSYDSDSNTLDVDMLDFGEGAVVADIIFHNNYWWIAVNRNNYKNGERTQIYLYDAGAVSSVLADEMSVGIREFGCMRVIGGTVYVTYSTTLGVFVGYISGKSLVPIGCLNGSLPNYAKNTEHRGMFCVTDGTDIFLAGSSDKSLPLALSKFAYTGTTVNALGFWTAPFIATESGSVYSVYYFDGFSTYPTWDSLIFNLAKGDKLATIDKVVVLTKALGANARCDLTLKTNQAVTSQSAMAITGTGYTRHVFKKAINKVEDLRVSLSWANGNATNDAAIREIQVMGHWDEHI